jgi:2-C-methyl-D-erythritol 4-phosphate cytidylyltransferase
MMPFDMRWGAVIAAGGRGERFGGPKQFIELAGTPMLGWSIRVFASMSEVREIVIAIDPALVEKAEALLEEIAPEKPARVVAGGITRQESVRHGITALGEEPDALLVHDGARPLVRAQNVRAGMREVRPGRGAVLATPVIDTIKIVDQDSLRVLHTIDRSTLWQAQTPQLAMLSDFRRAYEESEPATDDVALLERIGIDVVVVPSHHANFKVTVPDDVPQAEAILRSRLEAPAEHVLVEIFGSLGIIETVCHEIEALGGRVDAIERELPRGAAVRAYMKSDRLREFEASFVPLAEGTATLTVHDVGSF